MRQSYQQQLLGHLFLLCQLDALNGPLRLEFPSLSKTPWGPKGSDTSSKSSGLEQAQLKCEALSTTSNPPLMPLVCGV